MNLFKKHISPKALCVTYTTLIKLFTQEYIQFITIMVVKLMTNLIRKMTNEAEYIKTCLRFSSPRVKKYALSAIILGFSIAAFEYLFIYFLQNFFHLKKLVGAPQKTIEFLNVSNEAIAFSLVIIIGTIKFILEGFRIYVGRATQNIFIRDTRVKILSISLYNGNSISISDALSFFGDDSKRGADALFNLINIVMNFSILILLTIIASQIAFKELVIACGLLSLSLLPLKFVNAKTLFIGTRLTTLWNEINSLLTNNIRNNFYISLYGQAKTEEIKGTEKLDQNLSDYLKAFVIIAFNQVLPSLTGLIIISTITFLVNKESQNNAYLVSFFYIFLRISQNLSGLNSYYNNYKINLPSITSLSNWTSQFNSTPSSKSINISEEIKEISLKNISFSYENKPVFKDLSVTISKGIPLVITGESGSGKSTLLKVILGLQKTSSGQSLLNGKEIYQEDSTLSFSDTVAYVGSTPYLIPGTIRENLFYGSSSLKSEDQIHSALKKVCLFERIQSLDNGLEESVNEHADILSTGEKQRLMIARAILKDPQVLILDEFTSNLDLHIQGLIIENLKELFMSKICIIVSHRTEIQNINHNSLDMNAYRVKG
jgi:ABC-type multidrug transport system fused ATPase/permease subunit